MSQAFDHLVALVAHLRSPEGCSWDRKQTHDSLRPHLLEETYEVLETLDSHHPGFLQEELGDLLLQILLHAQIEDERGHFSMNTVVTQLSEKLIRRHPHVFRSSNSDEAPLSADQAIRQWESIKQTERDQKGQNHSILDGIPKTLPSLLRAHQIQSRASRVGFDWKEPDHVVDKLDEEFEELREAIKTVPLSSPSADTPAPSSIEEEFGDILFTACNMARFLHVNPEEALRKATNRFVSRFQFIESQAAMTKKQLQELTPQEWNDWWEEAKKQAQTKASHDIP